MTAEDACWVVTTGEAGMRSQALGLAEAVGLPVTEKRISVRAPWPWFPAGLLPTPLSALDHDGDRLAPPWPRLLVACGRRSIGPSLAVKRQSKGHTLTAYVQNPEWAGNKFDLVAAMPHDDVTGPNVVTVHTALHPITPERLEKARKEWHSRLALGDAPLLGVLVGGDNGSYSLTAAVAAKLIQTLRTAHQARGLRTIATPSRRTGDRTRHLLTKALAEHHLGSMWDETSPNPYTGILALADRLIVTGESISMISEALATGRPVHVLPLEGHGRRHDRFLKGIVEKRLVSLIEEDGLDWNFTGQAPIYATAEPAARLRAMLGLERR